MRRKLDQPDGAAKREAGRGASEAPRSGCEPRNPWIHWRDQRTLACLLAIYGLAIYGPAIYGPAIYGSAIYGPAIYGSAKAAGGWRRELAADATGGPQSLRGESLRGASADCDRPVPPRLQVDLNTATAGELSLLPGIGPRLAERLRESRPFRRVSEVVRVRGIGWKTCERLRASAWCSTAPVEERADPPSDVPSHR